MPSFDEASEEGGYGLYRKTINPDPVSVTIDNIIVLRMSIRLKVIPDQALTGQKSTVKQTNFIWK